MATGTTDIQNISDFLIKKDGKSYCKTCDAELKWSRKSILKHLQDNICHKRKKRQAVRDLNLTDNSQTLTSKFAATSSLGNKSSC